MWFLLINDLEMIFKIWRSDSVVTVFKIILWHLEIEKKQQKFKILCFCNTYFSFAIIKCSDQGNLREMRFQWDERQ